MLCLIRIKERSRADAAGALGRTENAVKKLLARAIRASRAIPATSCSLACSLACSGAAAWASSTPRNGAASAAAHSADVLHRDLKPSNLFLEVADSATSHATAPPLTTTTKARLRLFDFGLARRSGGSGTLQSETPVGTPRRIDPRVPRDVENIVQKALEKPPNRRHPSANELADDLANARGEADAARAVQATRSS